MVVDNSHRLRVAGVVFWLHRLMQPLPVEDARVGSRKGFFGTLE